MKTCPNCGFHNADGRSVCKQCHQSMSSVAGSDPPLPQVVQPSQPQTDPDPLPPPASQPPIIPAPTVVPKKLGLWIKVGLGLGAFVVGCCVLLIIIGTFAPSPKSTANAPTPAIAKAIEADPTKAIVKVAEVAPTEAPTNTPEPTNTPAPTPTETPIPATATPIPRIEISGSGQQVTDPVTLPSVVSRITFTHQGRRNFIVTVYSGDTSDLMVNTIGKYKGIRPLAANAPVYFEVNADGKWSILIEAMGPDLEAAALTGSGDYASGLFAPPRQGPVPYNFVHTGTRNFIVQLHCAGGSDVVQNEIGPVDGSAVVRYPDGPCFWEVQADGKWSITVK